MAWECRTPGCGRSGLPDDDEVCPGCGQTHDGRLRLEDLPAGRCSIGLRGRPPPREAAFAGDGPTPLVLAEGPFVRRADLPDRRGPRAPPAGQARHALEMSAVDEPPEAGELRRGTPR